MKKLSRILILLTALAHSICGTLHAQNATLLHSWTASDGRVMQAKFVRLDGEAVVVEKNGKQFPVPFAKLSAASVEQARKLGALAVAAAGPPLLQHNLLVGEMDRTTADMLEKGLAGDAAAAAAEYAKLQALLKQRKVREIARAETRGKSGETQAAEPTGRKITFPSGGREDEEDDENSSSD